MGTSSGSDGVAGAARRGDTGASSSVARGSCPLAFTPPKKTHDRTATAGVCNGDPSEDVCNSNVHGREVPVDTKQQHQNRRQQQWLPKTGEACLTPIKMIGRGTGGAMGVSPSVDQAVRIPPMVRRPEPAEWTSNIDEDDRNNVGIRNDTFHRFHDDCLSDPTTSRLPEHDKNRRGGCVRDSRGYGSSGSCSGDISIRVNTASRLSGNPCRREKEDPARNYSRNGLRDGKWALAKERNEVTGSNGSNGTRSSTQRRRVGDGNDDGDAALSSGGKGRNAAELVSVEDAVKLLAVGNSAELGSVGDEWKEACTAEGRIYYYNRRTRVPRWTLPPSATYVPDPSRPAGYRIWALSTPPPSFKGRAGLADSTASSAARKISDTEARAKAHGVVATSSAANHADTDTDDGSAVHVVARGSDASTSHARRNGANAEEDSPASRKAPLGLTVNVQPSVSRRKAEPREERIDWSSTKPLLKAKGVPISAPAQQDPVATHGQQLQAEASVPRTQIGSSGRSSSCGSVRDSYEAYPQTTDDRAFVGSKKDWAGKKREPLDDSVSDVHWGNKSKSAIAIAIATSGTTSGSEDDSCRGINDGETGVAEEGAAVDANREEHDPHQVDVSNKDDGDVRARKDDLGALLDERSINTIGSTGHVLSTTVLRKATLATTPSRNDGRTLAAGMVESASTMAGATGRTRQSAAASATMSGRFVVHRSGLWSTATAAASPSTPLSSGGNRRLVGRSGSCDEVLRCSRTPAQEAATECSDSDVTMAETQTRWASSENLPTRQDVGNDIVTEEVPRVRDKGDQEPSSMNQDANGPIVANGLKVTAGSNPSSKSSTMMTSSLTVVVPPGPKNEQPSPSTATMTVEDSASPTSSGSTQSSPKSRSALVTDSGRPQDMKERSASSKDSRAFGVRSDIAVLGEKQNEKHEQGQKQEQKQEQTEEQKQEQELKEKQPFLGEKWSHETKLGKELLSRRTREEGKQFLQVSSSAKSFTAESVASSASLENSPREPLALGTSVSRDEDQTRSNEPEKSGPSRRESKKEMELEEEWEAHLGTGAGTKHRRPLGPVRRSDEGERLKLCESRADTDFGNGDVTAEITMTSSSTCAPAGTPATAVVDLTSRSGRRRRIRDEGDRADTVRLSVAGVMRGEEKGMDGDGRNALSGSSVLGHEVRRQLFSEESEARPLVFCPFCGDGVLSTGGLKDHLQECYVFDRCRGGPTHTEVEAALRAISTTTSASHATGNEAGNDTVREEGAHVPGDRIIPDASHEASASFTSAANTTLRLSNNSEDDPGHDRGNDPEESAPQGLDTVLRDIPSNAAGIGPENKCRNVLETGPKSDALVPRTYEEENKDDNISGGAEAESPRADAAVSRGAVGVDVKVEGEADVKLEVEVEVEQCEGCRRTFAPGRLRSHAKACRSVFLERRRPYDLKAMRAKGTPLEFFQQPITASSGIDLAENGVDESTSGKEKRKVPTRSMRATVRHREGAEGGHANQGLPKRPVQKRRQKALPRVEGSAFCPSCKKSIPRTKYSAHLMRCTTARKNRLAQGVPRGTQVKKVALSTIYSESNSSAQVNTRQRSGGGMEKVLCPHCHRGFRKMWAPTHVSICAGVENRPNGAHKTKNNNLANMKTADRTNTHTSRTNKHTLGTDMDSNSDGRHSTERPLENRYSHAAEGKEVTQKMVSRRPAFY